MSNISKRLSELIAADSIAMSDAWGKLLDDIVALESASSEPVAWMHSNNSLGIPAITVSKKIGEHWMSEFYDVKPLYTAPPQAVTVPDGWALVPVEPTESMVIDGFESEPSPYGDSEEWEAYEVMSGCQQAARRAKLCWAAMIAAAPKQENTK